MNGAFYPFSPPICLPHHVPQTPPTAINIIIVIITQTHHLYKNRSPLIVLGTPFQQETKCPIINQSVRPQPNPHTQLNPHFTPLHRAGKQKKIRSSHLSHLKSHHHPPPPNILIINIKTSILIINHPHFVSFPRINFYISSFADTSRDPTESKTIQKKSHNKAKIHLLH